MTFTAGTATLSGTPTSQGIYTFQVRVTNGTAQATSTFTLEVGAVPVITSDSELGGGVDRPFTTVLQASGAAPITWEYTISPSSGANIQLNSNGALY